MLLGGKVLERKGTPVSLKEEGKRRGVFITHVFM